MSRKNIIKILCVVGAAFLCALLYDGWINRGTGYGVRFVGEDSETPKRNLPADETVTVADLLEAFKTNRDGASKQYIGKVVMIRGLVGEVVKDGLRQTERNAQRWYHPESQLDKYVLLVSETHLQGWHKETLPFDRSRDVFGDAVVQFEGVYCEFERGFAPYRVGENMNKIEKKELLVRCQIKGYERGVITKSDGYRSTDYPAEYRGHEKDKVLAVNCTERDAVVEKDPFE
ncbi:MAG: hypothetical protein JOZ96_18075 [Acidobacteria bacterium]|nr:hypothetical protein [Acidobacteriota bacterium]